MTAEDIDAVIALLSITDRAPIEMTGPVTVGRDPRAADGAVVVVDDDPLVSKSHLAIDVDRGHFVVTDLGSSNGTFLHHAGGETAVPTDAWIPVPPDAEIEFGDQRMTIRPMPLARAPADAPTVERPVGDQTPAVVAPDPWSSEASAAVGDEAECTRCSRSLAPDAKFCDGCGAPVTPGPDPWNRDDDVTPVHDHRPPPPPPVVPVPPVAQPTPGAPPPPAPSATVVVPSGAFGAVPPLGPPGAGLPQGPPAAPFDLAAVGATPQGNGPVFVDLASESGSSGRWVKMVLAASGALIVLGLAAFGISRLVGGDDDGSGGAQNRTAVPESVDEIWSASVDGEPIGAVADGAGVYVTTVDVDSGELDVVALDRATGDESWATTLDEPGDFADPSGLIDGVLIVAACAEACTLAGLDATTGDVLWSADGGDGFPTLFEDRLYAVDGGVVELLDPRTGDRIERLSGDEVRFDAGHVLLSDRGDVEIFDLDLTSVLGPVAVDQADAVAYDGRRLIVAERDELRIVDRDGVVLETNVDVGRIGAIHPVSDDNIVLDAEDGVISVEPRDGAEADERWSERGELDVVADVDGSTVAIVDQGGTFDVIDVESGDRRFAGDLAQPDAGFTFAGRNALVVYEFGDFGDPTGLTAFDWETGDEIWIERFDSFPLVLDGVIIEVSRDGDVVVSG